MYTLILHLFQGGQAVAGAAANPYVYILSNSNTAPVPGGQAAGLTLLTGSLSPGTGEERHRSL